VAGFDGILAGMDQAETSAAGTRIDLWLWAARFFKTRSLAKQAVESGHVELNDSPCKPAKALRVGDRLRIVRGEERLEVDVRGLSAQRGPAAVAQALYEETDPAGSHARRPASSAGWSGPRVRCGARTSTRGSNCDA
jgi:Ribosome-associated heat shock protein implicated in the recycling of the 50S subunit (S4 paralog)